MKISLCQIIAIVCILSVGFMTAAPFVQIADAGPIAIYEGTEFYVCLRGRDYHECAKKPRPYRSEYEPFWHRINPFAHPHDEPEPIEQDIYGGEIVTYCDECNVPTW